MLTTGPTILKIGSRLKNTNVNLFFLYNHLLWALTRDLHVVCCDPSGLSFLLTSRRHRPAGLLNTSLLCVVNFSLSPFRSVPPCTTRRVPASSRTWWQKRRRTASRSRCPSTSSLQTSLMRKPPPALRPSLLAFLPAGWWEKRIYFVNYCLFSLFFASVMVISPINLSPAGFGLWTREL